MEAIFYAILALHTARKSINRDNIEAVLKKAGQPVQERALDALVAFIDSLTAAPAARENDADPRIIRFLTSELARQKVDTGHLENLLATLTKAATAVPAPGNNPEREDGRYIYGVVVWNRESVLGPVGIEGREVYTIPYRDLSAIVHNCSARPYQSTDSEVVERWVRAHQDVLDIARKKFGTVVPAGFDTILRRGDEGASPERAVTDWLEHDYQRLQALKKKIEGKDEYGVQVSYQQGVIMGRISASPEVKEVQEKIAAGSAGAAYMYRQKLEKIIKNDTERLADEWFRDFYERIRHHADDIVVGKTRQLGDGRVMLLNLSCLVAREKVEGLGIELEGISNMDGFAVRFTGPWPAYNFVAGPMAALAGE